jgi:hypothetical protein
MKKVIYVVCAVLVTAAVVTFSLVNWNKKIDTTTEKAKEKIEVVKKIDPNLTGHATNNNINSADTSKGQDNGASTGNGSQSGDTSTENNTAADGGEGTVEAQGGITKEALPGTSFEEIKAAYQKVFSELEVQEGSKVDQVVVQAKADFVSGKYSKAQLVEKYQEFAELLEGNADKTFNAYYKQMQLDLEKYGHDVNAAIPYKNEYNAKKQERMSHIISELSQF